MKQEVFDILLYLFENYIYEDEDLDPDEIEKELQSAGFNEKTIDKAFAWLDGLSAASEGANKSTLTQQQAIRIYTQDEMLHLDTECRGFLLFLEQMGVLDDASRETVIDRIMALDSEDMNLEQLKWVVLMVIFNQPGGEAATAWMEDIVIDQMATQLH
jgi:Smg protein